MPSQISGQAPAPSKQQKRKAKKPKVVKAANAVVVTANYRVGPLGFFNMAQLKGGANAPEDSGNFALLDIIQALKFVKNNIAAFSGDPGNVTIMGQSAGSTNVNALIVSPLAAGLFHKAVSLSGGVGGVDISR